METLKRFLLIMLVTNVMTGCVPVLIGGGMEGAVVASQERTAGHAVDDATIFVKIKASFAQNNSSDLFANVDVKVVEGRVLLTGNVDKPETQVNAVDLTWKINGVKEVINEIQINDKSGFGNYARDVWISTQVRTKFLLTRGIRSINYSVITVNQSVYLMGIAQDQAELDRAIAVASNVSYVQKVISHVTLKDDPSRK